MRLLGIGRNEYIDIMNKRKSGGRGGLLNLMTRRKTILSELLPNEPVDVAIEAWWVVRYAGVTEEVLSVRKTTQSHRVIEALCRHTALPNSSLFAALPSRESQRALTKAIARPRASLPARCQSMFSAAPSAKEVFISTFPSAHPIVYPVRPAIFLFFHSNTVLSAASRKFCHEPRTRRLL